jgi:DNA modification methylase
MIPMIDLPGAGQTRLDVGVDAATWLDAQASASADALLTSPPYWCQRTYGTHGAELGREAKVTDYIASLSAILHRAHRVLKPGGWLLVNVGDTYFNQPGGYRHSGNSRVSRTNRAAAGSAPKRDLRGQPRKSLACVPDRLKLAMIDKGWALRSVVIWAKPNPVPATVVDRWWTSWEPILAFTTGPRTHWFDASPGRLDHLVLSASGQRRGGDHPASMPADLVRRMILQCVPPGGTVIDPFAGSGTTLAQAMQLGRTGLGCDLYRWSLASSHIPVVEWSAAESSTATLED